MAELVELTQWELFIKDLSILLIKEFRSHPGKPVDALKDIAVALVADKMRQELTDAIQGSQNIPAEVAAGTTADWIQFAINTVFIIPEVIEAFTAPVGV